MHLSCAQSTLPRPIATAPTANNPILSMPIPSVPPLLRCDCGASAILRRSFFGPTSSPPYCFLRPIVARQNPSHVSRISYNNHSKNLDRALDYGKKYSTFAPIFSDLILPPLSRSIAVGMVLTVQANFFRVVVEDSHSASRVELLCVVRALLKKMRNRILVGEKVVVGSIDWVERRGMIENMLRKSEEDDRKCGLEHFDPPVANVNRRLMLFSMDQPKPDPLCLSRFLVEAESTGIAFTLALNKSELVSQETMTAWKSRLCSWGYDPICCSVYSKDGLDTLALTLRGQISVVVGPSGVGKSSLINALRASQNIADAAEGNNWFEPILGSKLLEDQHVNEVSARSGRGKHTTRNVSLLPLVGGGGYIADTPGSSNPSLMKVTKHSLAETFPEIRQMLSSSQPAKCAVKNCLHRGEPGCLVKGNWERYPYYLQILDEIELRTMGTKRENERFKLINEQPRLKIKKQQRQSRQRVKQSILKELNELHDDGHCLH